VKGLRIGRRRARTDAQTSSPLELALRPALIDGRWQVPDRFNFARDVVEALAGDPKRQALTFIGEDGIIEPRTFVEIAGGAARWASILAERGVQPKDRVVVVAGSSVQWLEIVLGVMKAGGVAVPCNPSLSAAALESRVTSTDASLVVAVPGCEPTIEQMSFAPEVHYVDEGMRRRASDAPTGVPTHNTSSRDVAFVFTTPGTSGVPREVAHTHGAVFAARAQAEHWLDAGPGDVVWCTDDSDSALAAWFTLAGPWSRGAEVVLHQGEFDPRERLEHLFRLGATILCQSASEYRAIAELGKLERFRSPRLRRLVSTGDFLEPEVLEVFQERWGLTIHNGYGQAETNIVVADGREAASRPGAVGRALPGYEVAVVDDQGNELPVGIEGDLAIRDHPPTLFAGYWEAPDETKAAFRGDWYLTGDVAMADEEGVITFVARAEDVITSSGRTFGPYEIEHVLRAHEAIAASAVVGVRDLQRGGQFVRAFVVPAAGTEGSEQLEAELRRYLAEVLREQQVPREIVFVEALPTVRGKVSRAALRDQPLSGRPLWEMPPTSQPEEAPSAPAPPVAEAVPIAPPPPPPPPAPIVAPEPVEVVSPPPEPVVFEPVVAEPEPVVVEPEPVVIEHEPVVIEPEPVVIEHEPVAVEPEPTPIPEPVAEVAPVPPAPEPELPEVPTVPEPVAEPPPPVEPQAASAAQPEPPPVPEPEDLGPLPDFVVVPSSEVAPPPPAPPAPPESEPEPEPEPELGPLPDYVVDPSRPIEPRMEPAETPQAADARPSFPGLVPKPEPKPSAAEAAGLYFPPVTSFPDLRTESSSDGESRSETRKTPPRRPAAEAGKSKRKRSLEEPGDDAGAVEWMAGLSNRLSAYSLAEDGAEVSDEPREGDPGEDEPGA
jgi:acyl-coenzyme A synthetase/AMP-(fatty) acid ligase